MDADSKNPPRNQGLHVPREPSAYTDCIMEHFGRPAAPLRPFVRGYVQLDIRLPEPVILPIPARSASILEFTLGDPFRLLLTGHPRHEFAYPVNVVGVQTYRRVELSMRGNVHTFAVLFQPGGYGLFGIRSSPRRCR